MGWWRTVLRLVLICYAVHQGAAVSLDVVWVSPTEEIVYQPEDTVIGKWTPITPLVSPSVKLCRVTREPALKGRGGDGEESLECGTAIWLQAQELKDGYLVTITAPEASRESEYRLEVQDVSGNVFTSPIFGLDSSSGGENPTSAELPSDSTKSSGFRAMPAEIPTAKVSGLPASTSETAGHSSDSKLGGSPGLVAPMTATITIPRIAVPSSPSTAPDVRVSRRPVPTAAFVVPLSAVSGVMIVAGLLFLNNRRKLAKKRRELKTLILSKRIGDSEEYGSMGEGQRTTSVLSRKGRSEHYDTSEPLPVPFPRPEPRVATCSSFTPMGSYSSSSTIFDDGLGYHYDEEPTVTRGKSLTDQYTTAGTKHRLEDCNQVAPVVMSGFLPARLSPVHVRSHSSETIHSLPLPPAQNALSMMEFDDAFHILTAEVKRS